MWCLITNRSERLAGPGMASKTTELFIRKCINHYSHHVGRIESWQYIISQSKLAGKLHFMQFVAVGSGPAEFRALH